MNDGRFQVSLFCWRICALKRQRNLTPSHWAVGATDDHIMQMWPTEMWFSHRKWACEHRNLPVTSWLGSAAMSFKDSTARVAENFNHRKERAKARRARARRSVRSWLVYSWHGGHQTIVSCALATIQAAATANVIEFINAVSRAATATTPPSNTRRLWARDMVGSQPIPAGVACQTRNQRNQCW